MRVPGDKSISHRALLLAALAEGISVVRGLSTGADVAGTAAAVQAMGAIVEGDLVTGGRSRLHEPAGVVDVGNSGTTIRLLAGLCAGFDWLTVLAGDASIARRPMDRVADPLRRMGARVDGRDGGRLPPITVRGGGLDGIDYDMPVASAQVKSAILLAGLSAEGETVVRESTPTRAHTEEMLVAAGVDIEVVDGADHPPARPAAPVRARRARRPVPGRLLGGRGLHRPRQRGGGRRRVPRTGPGRVPRRAGGHGRRRRAGGGAVAPGPLLARPARDRRSRATRSPA